MAEGAPIGALAVRIGADANDLVREMGKATTSLGKVKAKFSEGALAAAKFGLAAAAAGAAVFAFTKKVADVGDQFAKMSQKVGASVEFLSAFSHAAKLGGVSTEQMEKSIGRMTRTMSDAQNGLATAKRSFKDLDVEVESTDGSLRQVPDVLLDVADRIAGMTDATKQAALAQEVFGRSGLEMLPVLKQGSAALREHMEEAKRLGKVWSTEDAKAAEDFNDNVERLQGAVEGLSMKLAGPLIKALGDASKAMLEAQRRGEGFFSTISRGLASILTGDDATKWQRQFVNATDTLLRVQNELDRARHAVRTGAASGVSASIAVLEKRLVEAQAEVNRLLGIKPIIAPDEVPGDKPKGGKTGGRGMTDAEKKELEARRLLLGEQFQWELDEEQRVREEIDAIYIAAHEKRLEDEKQRQADLHAAMIEGYEWEQEQARQHGEELLAIDRAIAAKKKADDAKQVEARRKFVDNLAGLMNTSSKKAFEFGKKVSIAQAAVKGAQAVMDAWQAGMSTGGPWAPVIAAGYAAAAAVNAANIINNIRSQEFGGGGGAPVAPSQGASGVSPVGAGGAGPQQARGPDNIIHIQGESVSKKQLRELFDQLNEGSRDGGRFILAS